MNKVREVKNWRIFVVGDQYSGWKPLGVVLPQGEVSRQVAFDIHIEFDGSGYLLCCVAENADLFADTWHETIEEAEAVAYEEFGIESKDWDRLKC